MRKIFAETANVDAMKKLGYGDPAKGAQKIYELSRLPSPPSRLLLGKDSNHMVKEWHARLGQEIDEYVGWSENLGFEAER